MIARRESGELPAQLSYLTAAVSGALILALVVYLGIHAARPDRLAVIVAEVVPDEGWSSSTIAYVPIDVRNLGDRPASQVVIESEAPGAAVPEAATIDFLAGGERRRIYVAVPATADRSGMTARVVTFQEP